MDGHSVYLSFNTGYNANSYGFKITARAVIEETSVDLPWVLDLTKCVGLLAGKCAGTLTRGHFALGEKDEKAPTGTWRKWLESEFFCEGEFGLSNYSSKKHQLPRI